MELSLGGAALAGDDRSLAACGVRAGAVVHCSWACDAAEEEKKVADEKEAAKATAAANTTRLADEKMAAELTAAAQRAETQQAHVPERAEGLPAEVVEVATEAQCKEQLQLQDQLISDIGFRDTAPNPSVDDPDDAIARESVQLRSGAGIYDGTASEQHMSELIDEMNEWAARVDAAPPADSLSIQPVDGLIFVPGPFRAFNMPVPNLFKATNICEYALCFKVKTKTPNRYFVWPSVGVLQPGESKDVKIILQQQVPSLTRDDTDCLADLNFAGKFLVEYAYRDVLDMAGAGEGPASFDAHLQLQECFRVLAGRPGRRNISEMRFSSKLQLSQAAQGAHVPEFSAELLAGIEDHFHLAQEAELSASWVCVAGEIDESEVELESELEAPHESTGPH
jgi:hypothetical protein